jgi:hypothetical protein
MIGKITNVNVVVTYWYLVKIYPIVIYLIW